MIHGIPPRLRRALGAVGAAGLLMLGAPALAFAGCPHSASTNAFAQFGDGAAYTLAPGGSFEHAAPGWTLSNASIVAGNDGFNLVPGSHSLAIAAGGSAVSAQICVSSEYPTFRLVAHQLSGGPADELSVSLRWVNLLGITINTPVASLQGSALWSPTPVLQLGSSVPLWLPGTSLNAALVFSASATGSWAIDDVFIDPYSR